jgi:hypothetical protein
MHAWDAARNRLCPMRPAVAGLKVVSAAGRAEGESFSDFAGRWAAAGQAAKRLLASSGSNDVGMPLIAAVRLTK